MPSMQPIVRPASTRPGVSGSSSASESDVALYLGFVEELGSADPAGIAARFLAHDFVEHGVHRDHSAAETVARLIERRARFPGAEWTIELVAGVGGLVVCDVTMSCDERREREIVVARIHEGRIAECWRAGDAALDASAGDGARLGEGDRGRVGERERPG